MAETTFNRARILVDTCLKEMAARSGISTTRMYQIKPNPDGSFRILSLLVPNEAIPEATKEGLTQVPHS